MKNVLIKDMLLSDKECLRVYVRRKDEPWFPIHCHKELELNFIRNGAGMRRVVGYSMETIEDFELVLVGGGINLEHGWEQGNCVNKDIKQIIIHFSADLIPENLLEKDRFISIKQMFKEARNGISFPQEAIMQVDSMLDNLSAEPDKFLQFTQLLNVIYFLSKCDYRILASDSFTNVKAGYEDKRLTSVKEYISTHLTDNIKLAKLAEIAGMSPSAFSHFFKKHTSITLSDYIIKMKLSRASRALVSSTLNISEICYASGFNNMSNFNRIFKNRKGMSPKEFRELYKKDKVIETY